MRFSQAIILLCALALVGVQTISAQDVPKPESAGTGTKAEKTDTSPVADTRTPTVDEILSGVEKRYSGSGFTARFVQQSTIKAMDITDKAEGKLFIKRPGMMRWEYETPEKQIILTDGDSLWIFRPDDNQVMTGSAPAYFGNGKGASFLSDVRVIRKQFDVNIEKTVDPEVYRLKMIPKEKKLDITAVHLAIRKDTFEVNWIATYNSYEDETLILLTNVQFNQNIDDAVFRFQIPEGADIVQLEQ